MTKRTYSLVSLGISAMACAASVTAAAQTTASSTNAGPNPSPAAQVGPSLGPSGATAPTAAKQTAPVVATDNTLEQVVVTAQRRSQNLQNVPISVTSLSGTALATQQVTSTIDLGREVPNMFSSNNVGSGSANVYYIRGLGQTQSFPTFEPQVGTYVDDIYIARQNANNFALFGVQQVQVLNGPQGTLFGRNSAGGAVVVTLQKPGTSFGGDADIGYGSFSQFTGRFAVDLPVNDQLLTRTAAYWITNAGYVQDLTTRQSLNATHNWGVREAVTVLPRALPDVEWNLSADYQHNNSANLLNQPSATGGVNGSDRVSYSGFSTQGGALAGLLTGDKAGFGQGVIVDSYGVASNVKISLDPGTLEFISGYRGLNQALGADFASSSLGSLATADVFPFGEITLAQALRSYQLSQEVKWSSHVGQWLTYTGGVYYLYESDRNNYGQVLGLGPTLALPLNDQFEMNDTTSEAAYAQGDIHFTPKLTLTLGGRFTHEIKTVSAEPNAPGEGYTTAQVIAAGYSTHLDANEFTPRVALQYQLDPHIMLFTSATRGFQGGGWNGLTGSNPQDFNDFKPETVWSYEAGFRSETPDRRLRFNGTFFYENVRDYQLLSDNPVTNSFDTSNAANLEAYGLEAQVTWRPVSHLTLQGNIGSIRAFYYGQSEAIRTQQASCVAGVAASCDNGIVRADGSLATPVYTPPVQISASATYNWIFDKFTVSPTIAVQYVAREWFDTANTAGYATENPGVGGETRPRTLLDFGVTLVPDKLPIALTAECKNCTMVNYGVADLLGMDYFNTPGTWDVHLSYKF